MSSNSWDPDVYESNARFVTDLGAGVLDLLDPQLHERILDLGCGDGPLTIELAQRCKSVVGIDSSEEMIEAAVARGLDAHVMSGEALTFDREFDAVFSNAALHWMKDPDAVISGVARALKPGGRFVGEFGGHGCVAAVLTGLLAVLDRHGIDGYSRIPWYFPTTADYRSRLEHGGFDVSSIALFNRPTPLPGSVTGWLDTFAGPFLYDVPDREAISHEVAELLEPSLCDEQGNWHADYVRLRFSAVLR